MRSILLAVVYITSATTISGMPMFRSSKKISLPAANLISSRQLALPNSNYGTPGAAYYTVTNPRNQQEPILIQITNVVSPQVTSNSNAISNANSVPTLPVPGSVAFHPPPISDYSQIPFLSGTALIPFSGDPAAVKMVYIPVYVPINATSSDGTATGNGGSLRAASGQPAIDKQIYAGTRPGLSQASAKLPGGVSSTPVAIGNNRQPTSASSVDNKLDHQWLFPDSD